jgi:Sulfite exporter TauE/SafE
MNDLLFPFALTIIAVLYSAVGQAGGTGYVALMGLAGFAPAIIKPTALSLNVMVSAIGCARFHRLRLLTWRTAYPFAVLGLPFSLLGGTLHLPPAAYQPVAGALLLVAGSQMARTAFARKALDDAAPATPPFIGSLLPRRGYWAGIRGDRRWRRYLSCAACAVAWVGGDSANSRHLRRVQPANLDGRTRRHMGNAPTAASPIARLASLRGLRWASRLMGRSAAPQATNTAITSRFPLACGGGENDHCLALVKRVRIRDQACHCRSFPALIARGRHPSRRSRSQRGQDAPICM